MHAIFRRPIKVLCSFLLFGLILSPFSASAKSDLSIPLTMPWPKDVKLLNVSPLTLYENLHVNGARWSVVQESHFIHLVGTSFHGMGQCELGQFVNPRSPHQKYYFAVLKNTLGKPVAYAINRRIFLSLINFRHAIHDHSDWEMIGSTLGLYSGTVSVPLSS